MQTIPWWLKLLHTLPPETAHRLVGTGLRIISDTGFYRILSKFNSLSSQSTKIFSRVISSPVGVAAGLDKNAYFVKSLFALGFGMVEVGTITPQSQPGNSTPRLFRDSKRGLLVNRMGFNSQGLARILPRLKKLRQGTLPGLLGINIGKNSSTRSLKLIIQDYLTCLREVYPYADYIVINLSSPNSFGLRELLKPKNLPQIIKTCSQERKYLINKYGYSVPLLLKISPDSKEVELKFIVSTLLENNWDGIVSTNTTTSGPQNCSDSLLYQKGGLSGPYLFQKSLQMLIQIRKITSQLIVIGCGGISTKEDLQKMLNEGAQAIQVYTSFIYQGPTVLKRLIL